MRVRLEVLPGESHDAVDAVPDAPKLAIVAAPRGEVIQTDLPPPGSACTDRHCADRPLRGGRIRNLPPSRIAPA